MSTQSGVLTAEEIEQLTAVINQINDLIKNAEEGKHLEVLKKVHQKVQENLGLLQRDPDTFQAVEDVEYSLAYNSLLDGADPSEVRASVLPGVWDKIVEDGVILDMAEYNVVNSLADGDFERARQYFEKYRQYLPREAASELGVLVGGEMQQLISAVNSEDAGLLYQAIRRLEEEGRYEQYKQIASKYLGLDLDELRRLAYQDRIFRILEEAGDLDEAYQKLSDARSMAEEAGLQDLVQDLDHAKAALDKARAGDAAGFVDEASKIRDTEILKYTLAKAVPALGEEAIAGLPEGEKRELQALLSRAGFDVSVDNIEKVARAYEVAVDLNKLVNGNKPEDALQLWNSLDGDMRAIVAAIVGMTVEGLEQALETAVYAKKVADEANKLAGLLNSGRYLEAYEYWNSLSPEDRKAVAALLEEEEEDLDRAIRLAAGFQELQELENPTLDQVKAVLAKYVGEEEADRIARELLEDSPLYQAKKLADEGKYEEALAKALQEVPEEERSLAVQYILASISEAKGPEQLAQFIQEHEDQLKPYLSSAMLGAVQAYSQAGVMAEDLINVITEEAAKEYGDRIKKIVSDFKAAVRQGDFQRAEEILVRNQQLLRQAEVDGVRLLDLLAESLSTSMIADWLDKAAGELDQLANSEPGKILSRAPKIREMAEEKLRELQQMKYIDAQTKQQLSEALKRLMAYTYVLESQAHLQNGWTEYALDAAEKAKELSPDLADYYNTMKILVTAIDDKANLTRNLECILENVLNIKPKRGGGRRIQTRYVM